MLILVSECASHVYIFMDDYFNGNTVRAKNLMIKHITSWYTMHNTPFEFFCREGAENPLSHFILYYS